MIFYCGFLIPFLEFFFDKIFPKLALGVGGLLLASFIWNALGPVLVIAAVIALSVFLVWRQSKKDASAAVVEE